MADDTVDFVERIRRGGADADLAVRELVQRCNLFNERFTAEELKRNRLRLAAVPGLFDALTARIRASDTPEGRWRASMAIGFIAFDDAAASLAAVTTPGLIDLLSDLLEHGSEAEREWGAGTIANICVCDLSDEPRNIISRSPRAIRSLTMLCSGSGSARLRAVGAINNISRSVAARESLVRAGVVEHGLASVLGSRGTDDVHRAMVARATMAVANLTGRDEQSLLAADRASLETVVQCLEYSLRQGDERVFAGVIWTVPVTIYPIYNLSIADANKKILMQAGLLPLLLTLLHEWIAGAGKAAGDSRVELSALELGLRTLYHMAFDHEAKRWLIENGAVALLDSIRILDPPATFRARRSAAVIIEEILWLLQEGPVPGKGGQWVMLSYNWGAQATVKRVAEALEQAGLKVWMDILPGCMTGNTLDAMAEGVGKAAVVLIFVTRPYKESANCRLEGSYAQDLRKPIIPVILESGYRMDGSWGWLGLIVAGKLYHDFSGPEEFPARMNALLEEIRTVGVNETGCDIVSGGAPAGSLLLEERSEEDLTAWLLTILGPRGLEQVAPVLRAHRITHRGMLTELQERDMDRLGLRIGHRVRLREALGAGGARAVPRKPGVPTGLCEDVREWLAELGLSNCIRIFEEQQILTMETVRCLRDEDIAAAIPLIGDRIILRRALRNLPGKD